MTYYSTLVLNPKFLVNIDEKSIYFDGKPTSTVNSKGEKRFILINGASSRWITLCVSIDFDGTKPILLVIFKGKPNRTIDHFLSTIFPNGIFG